MTTPDGSDDRGLRDLVDDLRAERARRQEAERREAKFWAVLFVLVFGSLAAYTAWSELHGRPLPSTQRSSH